MQGLPEPKEKGMTSMEEVIELKKQLVNTVCACMIAEPRFDQQPSPASDPAAAAEGSGGEASSSVPSTALVIVQLVEQVAQADPEFILKLALYVRQDLNIRSTANFLLALAANLPPCSPFLKKYFRHVIRLPSDWLDVAALYQLLPNRGLQGRALPTALRKAMRHKFSDFDFYQLGKYNKAGKLKRMKRKAKRQALIAARGGGAAAGGRGGRGGGGRGGGAGGDGGKTQLTIKQMIRQLHISEPVEPVMCVLGKKYPRDENEFLNSHLPGMFDSSKAGKRMKLPVPETWETLLSAKGNKAETWEELIDHKKLPFMAMLRNLRNLILTGVDYRCHRWAMNKLCNERAVAQSRQFPFRFFSAYEAINVDIESLRQEVKQAKQAVRSGQDPTTLRRKREPKAKRQQSEEQQDRRPKKLIIPKNMPDEALIKKYKEALDTAVKYATVHNVKPIRGSTVVFCSVAASMRDNCKTAKGMGSVRTLMDVGILLGLMCKYMCEECEFRLFSSPGSGRGASAQCHVPVNLKDGTILHNMESALQVALSGQLGDGTDFPYDYLEDLIRDRQRIDNFIVLSNTMIAPGFDERRSSHHPGGIGSILSKYRQEVNPDLLFVSVNLDGNKVVMRDTSSGDQHPNDVLITGFSDAILKYIAERGDNNQLHYIEHIDEAKHIQTPLSKAEIQKLKNSNSSSLLSTSSYSSPFKRSTTASKLKSRRSLFGMKKRTTGGFLGSGGSALSFGSGLSAFSQDDDDDGPFAKDKKKQSSAASSNAASTLSQEASQKLEREAEKEEKEKLQKKLDQMRTGKWREARVFVSSTFRDMHGERDYLVRYVFPELRERCRRRRINFYDVDLRWGLTQHEAEEGGSLEICLNEVDRCRPFFLGILGDRYGWVPSDYKLNESESDPKYLWLKNYPKGRSITELEMYYGALKHPEDSHCLFYMRNSDFLSQIEDEKDKEVFESESKSAADKQAELKRLIRESLGSRRSASSSSSAVVSDYSCSWGGKVEGKPMTTGLERFGEAVLRDLWNAICKAFPHDPVPRSPLLISREYHLSFMASRAKGFVGREDILKKLYAFVRGEEAGPLVITGEPGVGKSALIAKFAQDCAEKHGSSDGYCVLAHFVGASPDSVHIRHTLYRLCHELRERFDLNEAVPEEYKELRLAFPKFLELASFALTKKTMKHGGKIVLIIDALNQLEEKERAHSLDWLPALNNSHTISRVRIILSTYAQSRTHDVLRFRKPPPTEFNLDVLEERHAKELVRTTLSEFRKKLDESPGNNQMRLLLRKMEATKPLYLVVACEELRVFGLFEALTQKIKDMGSTVAKLFEEVLHRLEVHQDPHLLKVTLCLIHCSRGGIMERELLHVLATQPRSVKKITASASSSSSAFGKSSSFGSSLGSFSSSLDSFGSFDAFDSFGSSFSSSASSSSSFGSSSSFKYTPSSRFGTKSRYSTSSVDKDKEKEAEEQEKAKEKERLRKAQEEAQQKLKAREEALKPPTRKELPQGIWSPLVSSLQPFLRPLDDSGEGRLTFFHAQMGFAVQKKFFVLRSQEVAMHKLLAEYFLSHAKVGYYHQLTAATAKAALLAGPEEDIVREEGNGSNGEIRIGRWRCNPNDSTSLRSISELPYHLCRAEMWSELEETLTDLSYVELKCRLGMTFDLITDLTEAVSSAQGKRWDSKPLKLSSEDQAAQQSASNNNDSLFGGFGGSSFSSSSSSEQQAEGLRRLKEFKRFVSSDAHILAMRPELTFQQAANQPEGSFPCLKAKELQWLRKITQAARRPLLSSLPSSSASNAAWLQWLNKPQNQSACLMTMSGNTEAAMACAFSPDGSEIVVASRDQTLRICDAISGQEKATLAGHTNWVVACAYSPDGRNIVSASWDQTLKVWDARAGVEVATLSGHTRRVNACAYSQDGQYIASGSWDCSVKIWSAATGKQVKTLTGHSKPVNAVAFSPDGRRLVSASWDCTIKLWNLGEGAGDEHEKGTVELTLAGHSKSVRSVQFSPNGLQVVSTSVDKTVKVWDCRTGELTNTLTGHSEPVNTCAFSSDGKQLVSASDDLTVKVWDATGGREVATMKNAHSSSSILTCAYSWDGQRVVSASSDCGLAVWDVIAGEVVTAIPQAHSRTINAVKFSPDGELVASASDDGTIKLWNSEDLASGPIRTLTGHADCVNDLDFSSDGERLLSASDDFSLRLWNVHSGALVGELKGHTNRVKGCAFSPDMKRVASASRDNTLRIWDPSTGQVKKILRGHKDWLEGCTFSPDGKLLVSCSWDFNIMVWDVRQGCELGTLSGHSGAVSAVSINAEGTHLVSSSYDGTLKIWDLKKLHLITTIDGHYQRVNRCAFARNAGNSLIVSCSEDNCLKFWDSVAGQEIVSLQGHSETVRQVAYAPSTNQIVSASEDCTVKVWDASSSSSSGPSEEGSGAAKGHTQWINACRLFRNNDGVLSLLSGSRDGTAKLWEIATASLKVKRNLIGGGKSSGGSVNAVAVSPDGSRAVTAADEADAGNFGLVVWDLRRGKPLCRLQGAHTNSVMGCCFSPDGQRIASAAWDNTVRVWGAARGELQMTLEGHHDWVDCVCFSPDGSKLVSGSRDCSLIVWDLRYKTAERNLTGHSNWVSSVSCSDSFVLSTSYDGEAILWDLRSGRKLSSVRHLLSGAEEEEASSNQQQLTKRINDCVLSSDGRRFFTVGHDGSLCVWESGTSSGSDPRRVCQFFCKAPATAVAAMEDDGSVVVGDSLGNIYFLRLVA